MPSVHRRQRSVPQVGNPIQGGSLARALVLDTFAGMTGGSGASRNRLNRLPATVNTPNNLTWSPGHYPLVAPVRDSTVQGGSQYETLTFPTLFDWSKGFAVEVWCYIRSFQAASPYISALFNLDNQIIVRFGDVSIPNNAVEFGFAGQSCTSQTTFGTHIPIHIVANYGGPGQPLTLFCNGKLESTSSGTLTLGAVSLNQCYLWRDDNTTRAPDGQIMACRVWNRGLAEGEVQSLYKNPYGIYAPTSPKRWYLRGSGTILAGAATITGTGILSGQGTLATVGSASIAGSLSLDALGFQTIAGAAAIDGLGSLTATLTTATGYSFEQCFSSYLASVVPYPVYHGRIPQRAESYPAIVWQVVDADIVSNLSGPTGLEWSSVQVDVYCPDAANTFNAGRAVDKALNNAQSMPGLKLQSCLRHNRQTDYESPVNDSDAGMQRVMAEYKVFYELT